jgi:hypothetical protein
MLFRDVLFLAVVRVIPWAMVVGVAIAAAALSLTFAGDRQQRMALLLWPVAALLLWTSACLLLATAFATDPDNMDPATATRRLLGPLPVLLLGNVLGLVWLRHAIRRHRAPVA